MKLQYRDMSDAASRPWVPEPPASLDDDAAQRLAGLARAALVRQRAEAAEAIDAALDHVPRLARGPVRKVLGR
jgi:hypothetical protein